MNSKLRLLAIGLTTIAPLALPGLAHAGPAYWILTNADANPGTGHDSIDSYDSRYDSPMGKTSNLSTINASSAYGDAGAYAAASLSSALLRASSVGSPQIDGSSPFGTGSASAQFFDTLYFNIQGASFDTQTEVGINIHVDGTTSGVFGAHNHYFQLILGSNGGFAQNNCCSVVQNFPYIYGGQYGQDTLLDAASGFSNYTMTPINGGADGFNFQGIFSVVGSNPVITINEDLFVNASDGGQVDFQNTAITSFNLPGNTTFTSASGVFLTQPVNEIPEPTTMVLLGLGLLSLFSIRGQKRGSQSA